MSINADIATAGQVSKQRYTDLLIQTLVFQSETIGLLPKAPNYGGTLYVGALKNATQSTVSASDTLAFTSGGPGQYQQWQCPWREGYASANLTGRAIDQTNGDQNAMVDLMTSEEDGAWEALGVHLGAGIWGNGGGAIGQADNSTAYPVTGNTIRLVNTSQIVNFFVGQLLNASVSDDGTGGGAPIGAPTSAAVTAVDVTNGLVSISGNWSTVFTGFTTNSYLFNQGDFNAKIQGIPAWLPDVNHRASLSTAFNNVVRSNDPTRLAGVAYDGKSAPKSESLIQLLSQVKRMGGRPKHCILATADYADVVKDFSGRVQIVTETAFKAPQIGFEGLKVATDYGSFMIFEDAMLPAGNGYLLQLDTWLIPSMGKLPKVLGKDVDGNEWLRRDTSDAYQKRLGYRAATYCSAPGKNGVVTF